MHFTDTHAHIFNEYFEDFNKVIESAKNNNVDTILNAATSLKNIPEVLKTSEEYENIYACIGIHPEDMDDDYKKIEKIIVDNINNKKLAAIGEIGLDYYYTKENRDKQIEVFEFQLALAEKYNLPVVVHSREATLDTINSIKKFKVRGVIHCFSGSLETANIFIKLGFYFGVGGVMTFKNSKIDQVIKNIPLDRIVLETDSPYLTPEPFRKYSNEPKYIKTIAEYLADLKGISVEEVSSITEKNVQELYKIKK